MSYGTINKCPIGPYTAPLVSRHTSYTSCRATTHGVSSLPDEVGSSPQDNEEESKYDQEESTASHQKNDRIVVIVVVGPLILALTAGVTFALIKCDGGCAS